MGNIFYVYALCDPRKQGLFDYGVGTFEYEPFYIGKGSGNRAKVHFTESSMKRSNVHKNRVLKKIAKDGFIPFVVIVSSDQLEDDAFDIENKLIKFIGRTDLGTGSLTNKSDGGKIGSGTVWSKERRLAQSIRQKGKINEALVNANKNRVMSATARKKISESQKGKTGRLSEESRNKISEKLKGRMVSDETKALQSSQRLGRRTVGITLAGEKRRKCYIDFEDFKNIVRINNIKSVDQLSRYLKACPYHNIPSNAKTAYSIRGVWTSWDDVFGR